jgi:hypothetical protein
VGVARCAHSLISVGRNEVSVGRVIGAAMRSYMHPAHKVLIAVSVFLVFTGCGRKSNRAVEQPIPMEASSQVRTTPASSTPAPAPTPAEVREAVARVLGTDVVPIGGDTPVAVMGDFNGDTYADLVVAVKPVLSRLGDINADLANWLIQNPRHSYVPPSNKTVVALPPAPGPEKVTVGETLLVVIHGQGPQGWRDPLARQTYLLREAAGRMLRVAKPTEALARDFGAFPSARDVIAETLSGSPGVIYWTGAAYAWHAER